MVVAVRLLSGEELQTGDLNSIAAHLFVGNTIVAVTRPRWLRRWHINAVIIRARWISRMGARDNAP
jgi:hypothetical protein